MAQLMLINPAKRPTKRRKASPAQLRALAAGRRKRSGLAANPAPRRRRRTALRAVSRTTRRRARRNPVGMGGVMGNIMNAVQGAGGALAVNAVFNLLPLPLSLKTGMAVPAVKMALAVGVGMFAKPLLGRAAGKMAEGAMTVAAYEAIQGMLPVSMGGSSVAGLSGMGYMSPGIIAQGNSGLTPNQSMAGMGEYVSGMGEYVY